MKNIELDVSIRALKNGFLVYFGDYSESIDKPQKVTGEYFFETVNSTLDAVKEYMESRIRAATEDDSLPVVQQLNG